jgi:2-phosphosulfolactate phosphatase
MSQCVRVYLLPAFIEPADLQGGVAVVIDILRASTTIVHALAAGADAVLPFESVDDARAAAARLPAESVLLGGERGGERIAGFDLGNSPLEYTPEVVAGKTVVFTTTNGTRALQRCRTAERVLIGAFVNRDALLRVLQEDGRPVHLVCAGTDGHLTGEDILFAGEIADSLSPAEPDVQTQLAIDYWRARSADPAVFQGAIRSSRGGQNLLRLGMSADIDRAAECDLFDIVPEQVRSGDPADQRAGSLHELEGVDAIVCTRS